jgi:hypothetical protein
MSYQGDHKGLPYPIQQCMTDSYRVGAGFAPALNVMRDAPLNPIWCPLACPALMNMDLTPRYIYQGSIRTRLLSEHLRAPVLRHYAGCGRQLCSRW